MSSAHQTIPKPLSGAEVRMAIVHDISRILQLDDRLAAHVAYDGFSFKATIQVTLPSGVQQEFTREITGGPGIPGSLASDVATADVSRDLQPPNAVRMDTDQPVPTLVDNGKGQMEEKWISYVGKDSTGRPRGNKEAQGPPKRNVVKGGDIVHKGLGEA